MGSIRTLLALAVVFAHCPFADSFVFVGGENAVRLFYIASGYLISLVLASRAYPSTRAFYVNRWLRLWPMYAAVCVLTLAFYLLSDTGFFAFYDQVSPQAALVVALANVTLVGQDWLMFTRSDPPLYRGFLAPQSWTLGLEICFYLLAPWVLGRRRRIVGLLVASLALRAVLVGQGLDHDPWTYRFFPTELAWFLSGALAQQVLAPLYARVLAARMPAAAAAATLGFAALVSIFHLLPLSRLAGAALLVVLFIAIAPLALEFQRAHAWDRRIGDLSYPIYVGHFLVLQAVSYLLQRTGLASPGFLTAVVVVASVAFAFALDKGLGQPLERLRGRVRSGRWPAPGTAGRARGSVSSAS